MKHSLEFQLDFQRNITKIVLQYIIDKIPNWETIGYTIIKKIWLSVSTFKCYIYKVAM